MLRLLFELLMQMKTKEEREQKRARMDGRHDFILSTVAERRGLTIEEAEELMLEGDQVNSTLQY